jgi:hypothetical protein
MLTGLLLPGWEPAVEWLAWVGVVLLYGPGWINLVAQAAAVAVVVGIFGYDLDVGRPASEASPLWVGLAFVLSSMGAAAALHGRWVRGRLLPRPGLGELVVAIAVVTPLVAWHGSNVTRAWVYHRLGLEERFQREVREVGDPWSRYEMVAQVLVDDRVQLERLLELKRWNEDAIPDVIELVRLAYATRELGEEEAYRLLEADARVAGLAGSRAAGDELFWLVFEWDQDEVFAPRVYGLPTGRWDGDYLLELGHWWLRMLRRAPYGYEQPQVPPLEEVRLFTERLVLCNDPLQAVTEACGMPGRFTPEVEAERNLVRQAALDLLADIYPEGARGFAEDGSGRGAGSRTWAEHLAAVEELAPWWDPVRMRYVAGGE